MFSDGMEHCKICGTDDFGTKSGNPVHGKCTTCSKLVADTMLRGKSQQEAEKIVSGLVNSGSEQEGDA